MDDNELIALWRNYKTNPRVELRNRLFQHYSDWIRKIVSSQFTKYGGQLVEWSDCVQNASIALIGAIERFDLDRGIPFEAFAYSRVKGSIINGITHFQKQQKNQTTSESDTDFFGDFHMSSDPEEGFDSFVDSVIDLAFSKMLEISSYKFRDIERNPLDVYISVSEEEKIVHCVSMLPTDLAYIINAHYNHYLSFTQIAEEMNLSRSRISQLHKSALRKIRSIYETN